MLAHGTYSERQAAQTARTLLQTLAYLHSMGVVHRCAAGWGGAWALLGVATRRAIRRGHRS